MISRYISMSEICAGNLSGLKPGERDEAFQLFATGIANLARGHAATAAIEVKVLSLAAAAKLLRVSRPWLAASDLPFIHEAGRVRIVIESELRSFMGPGRFLKPAEAARILDRNVRWVTRNAEKLGLGKRLGPGVLRLSEVAVRRYHLTTVPHSARHIAA